LTWLSTTKEGWGDGCGGQGTRNGRRNTWRD
jgi:hypothetical protein